MRLPRSRFTLLNLMVAVAVIACFLALLKTCGAFLTVCVLLGLLLAAMSWTMLQGQRRLALWGFGSASVAVSCSLAGLSIYAFNMWGMAGMALGSLCGIPLILGFGTAWSAAATRREATRRRSPLLAWPLVIVLATLPLTILFTQWPFHLAFAASKPALNRLADRVAAGQAIRRPVRAGFFTVVSSAVDPASGNVGLITDPDPSGRSGFVRLSLHPNTSPGRVGGPFYNLNGDLQMGEGWRYQSED
ncbi:MAG: hypothetical protein ACLQIB_05890 [Isosphaeraceae bacterium]